MESTPFISFAKQGRDREQNRKQCREYYYRVLKDRRNRDPERRRATQRKYYAKNKTKQLEYNRQWRLKQRKKIENDSTNIPTRDIEKRSTIQYLPKIIVVEMGIHNGKVRINSETIIENDESIKEMNLATSSINSSTQTDVDNCDDETETTVVSNS